MWDVRCQCADGYKRLDDAKQCQALWAPQSDGLGFQVAGPFSTGPITNCHYLDDKKAVIGWNVPKSLIVTINNFTILMRIWTSEAFGHYIPHWIYGILDSPEVNGCYTKTSRVENGVPVFANRNGIILFRPELESSCKQSLKGSYFAVQGWWVSTIKSLVG